MGVVYQEKIQLMGVDALTKRNGHLIQEVIHLVLIAIPINIMKIIYLDQTLSLDLQLLHVHEMEIILKEMGI